jgi:hypothetical protein
LLLQQLFFAGVATKKMNSEEKHLFSNQMFYKIKVTGKVVRVRKENSGSTFKIFGEKKKLYLKKSF